MPRRLAFFFLVPLAFLAGLGLRYIRVIPATGDEVEYLLLAQSLWREHDIDVQDNFARGDHLEYSHPIGRMPYGTWRADGRPATTHSLGLPLLLAPLYAGGGRVACVLLMAIVAAALAAATWRYAADLTADREAALLAWLLCIGPPVFFYGFHLYTETLSAILTLGAFVALTRTPGIVASALAGFAVALLPWVHVKMIPAAAVLGLMGLFRLRGKERLAFLAPIALSVAGYAWHHERVYGNPTPLSLYGSKLPRQVKRSEPWVNLPGLLLDGRFGLLPLAPGFLLGAAGASSLWRRLGSARLWGAAVVAAMFGPLLFWQSWWAGHCPPARFFVPLVPFLAVAAACRVADSRLALARWRWGFAAWGLCLALYTSARPEARLLLPDRYELAPVFEAWRFGVSLNDVLPRLTPEIATPGRTAAWAVVVVLLLVLDARWRRKMAA